MNFYKRYIGDFQRKTAHLSLEQRGAYDALLDHYYATRAPLPADLNALCRIAGALTDSETDSVSRVVSWFFPISPDDGLRHNKRCDEEIAKWEAQAIVNREIGKRGGRRKKTESVSESVLESVSEQKPNKNPLQKLEVINTPPITPQGGGVVPIKPKRQARPSVTLKTFLEGKKKTGEKPIPETDSVFDYAEKAGIPIDWLHLCWREFVERHADGSKRYKDWAKAFGNCVRGNWYKLWYLDRASGQLCLSSNGGVAERVHAAH